MAKLSVLSPYTRKDAGMSHTEVWTQNFWMVQQQWARRQDHGLTWSQVNATLRFIIGDPSLPETLTNQAKALHKKLHNQR